MVSNCVMNERDEELPPCNHGLMDPINGSPPSTHPVQVSVVHIMQSCGLYRSTINARISSWSGPPLFGLRQVKACATTNDPIATGTQPQPEASSAGCNSGTPQGSLNMAPSSPPIGTATPSTPGRETMPLMKRLQLEAWLFWLAVIVLTAKLFHDCLVSFQSRDIKL